MTEERKDIIQNELAWHEEEAHRREPIDKFLYAPPAFEPLIDDGIAHLQVPDGEWLLELGCGEGKETVKFIAQGTQTVSIDLSHVQLQRNRELVLETFGENRALLVQANAEELPFARGSFQGIYAKAVLHHLDLDIAYAEWARVLREDGRLTITEPLAGHPIIVLGRLLTPRLRTRDERPIPYDEFLTFAHRYPQIEIKWHFLLAPLAYFFRILPRGERLFVHTHRWLQRIDQSLLRRLPFLRRLVWYGAIKASL